MRKLTKKISMLMVLAMLVGLFSGVVSASAASAWSFKSSKYDVAVNGEINMKKNEYADFDLLKDGKAPAGYTVVWESSDEDVVWVNAKTGQLRADKAKKAEDGDKAVISATFTNTKTKKSATRSFTIVVGEVKAPVYTVEQADVTAVLGDAIKFAPVVKNEAGEVVKFATHKSYNGYFVDGKAITNPWTPEVAGEYTVTVAQFAKKADVADLAKAVRKIDVKVTVKADLAAEATGLKEITVYGDFAKDAKFTVVKDGNITVAATPTIAEDGKSAELALTSRISKGTYTVTCGDATAEFVAEDEKVDSIVILENGGQIFTDADRLKAFAHYDVFNQYGESIRKSVDIRFASSADRKTEAECGIDPHAGVVEINTVEEAPFNYSNIVVLTAVVSNYNGYAKSETATLTIGLQNNIHSIKVKGIILEDTTKLLEAVPAEFVGGNYYMVFECYDRNGNSMKFDAEAAYDDLTFVSVSPLVIKDVKKVGGATGSEVKSVFIDGVEYGAVKLEAGQSVKQGGVADIKVTSKSGGSQDVQVRVLSNQVLSSFRVIRPAGVVAVNKVDGGKNDALVLEYEALDTEGKKITDFRALVNAVAFSDSRVKMEENADGSATLKADVSSVVATKEVDGQLVFSVIIPAAAKAENVTLYVKAARHADSIGAYEGTNEILEGDDIYVGLAMTDWQTDAKINFFDQYDELLDKGGAFGNTKVGVKIVAGEDDIEIKNGVAGTGVAEDYTLFAGGAKVQIGANHVTETVKDAVIELVIFETTDGVVTKKISGSEKKFAIKVVDLSQVVSFSTHASNWNHDLENGKEATGAFVVEGKLANGHKVDVPVNGNELGASVVLFEAASWGTHGNAYAASGSANFVVDLKDGNKIANNDFFLDASQKDAEGNSIKVKRAINVEAKIYVVSAVSGDTVTATTFKSATSATLNAGINTRDVASIVLKNPWWPVVVDVNAKTAVIKAFGGEITYENLVGIIDKITDNYGENVNYANVAADDAPVLNDKDLTITITNYKEGGKGLRTNDGYVNLNAQAIRKSENEKNEDGTNKMDNGKPVMKYPTVVMLKNVEIGDTFTATYKCGNVSVSVDFTVGSDVWANFTTIDADLWYK